MKNKAKNPLYVVKGKDVHEASGLLDMMVKKMGLESFIEVLENIITMFLQNVKNFQSFTMVKEMIDELVVRYFALIKKFGLA